MLGDGAGVLTRRALSTAAFLWFAGAVSLAAQGAIAPVSRSAAIEAAAARGGRLAIARADSLGADALLRVARQWQNPSLSIGYSRSEPQYHYALELPLDLPFQRRPRVGSAYASQRAARLRTTFERAAIAMEADITYTRALAAQALAELSTRTALDADSLRRIAIARRDAGDASDMEVALAAVTAGQAANQATSDSVAMESALLDLEVVIGIAGRVSRITLADSLTVPPDAVGPARVLINGAGAPVPLPIAAALAQLEAASLASVLARRSVFGAPSITAGFETGDPTGAQRGRLPTVGLALPLPLLNRNGGAVDFAHAEELRARAELALAEVQARASLARAERQSAAARAKVARSSSVVVQAVRLAAMSLVAYREGAIALPGVLEARRVSRELQSQYVNDLADAWIAEAELRIRSLTSAPRAP